VTRDERANIGYRHDHGTICRKLIEASQTGKSQGWAYREAGYDCENGASEAAASRLLKNC
jgi:hypothetical protein